MSDDEALARRLAEALRTDLEPMMTHAVKTGSIQAANELAKNSEFMNHFWHAGYDRLIGKGREDVQKSVGARILRWMAAALFGVAIYLATKAGMIK